MDKDKINTRIDEVVEICHLEEYIDVLIGKLSRGFRQRVGVAQAIIHEPEVLILDEPTIAIDPIQVAMTRSLIKDLGKEHTILLSSHILPEVSMICERVIIIHEGKIVAEDRIENLSSIVGGVRRIRLEVADPSEEVTKSLHQIQGIQQINREGSHYIIECDPEQDIRAKITETIVQGGWTLLALESIEMSLEDVFLKLTAEEESN